MATKRRRRARTGLAAFLDRPHANALLAISATLGDRPDVHDGWFSALLDDTPAMPGLASLPGCTVYALLSSVWGEGHSAVVSVAEKDGVMVAIYVGFLGQDCRGQPPLAGRMRQNRGHAGGFPRERPFKPLTRRLCYTQTQRANGARAGASADGGPVAAGGLVPWSSDFLKGEFIDVITWLDDTRDTMVWRFERRGNAIKYGAKLTVREGQAAVFVHEGQMADVFGPGMYMLETNNMPIMTTLQHWDHGFDSPFKSEIYFVNTTRFNDQKWGTKNPIMCRDPEFGPVRLRAFGTYSMRVTDPAVFLKEIVGTDGEFTSDEISNQIRNVIVQEASQVLAKSGIPVLDMAGNTADLGKLITTRDRAADRGLWPGDPGILHRKHQPARRGGKGDGQAHLDGGGGRSEQIHAVQRGRGHGATRLGRGRDGGRRHGRRHGDEHGGRASGPGARHRPQPRQRRAATAAARRARPGIWPRTAPPQGPFSEADLAAMAASGSADAGQPGLDRRAGRLESRRRHRTGAAVSPTVPPPPPPPGA